jgi:pyridoxal phosphate enzyme (YggS family)
MNTIANNLSAIKANMAVAAQRAGRDINTIQLLAVSKFRSIAAILTAKALGQRCFAESRVQEALPKISALADESLEWHFIGAMQTNKTRDIAEHFNWVHSLDSLSLAERLNAQRPSHLPPLQVCLQLKFNALDQRQGINLLELPGLVQKIMGLSRLRLRGLMMLPTLEESLHSNPRPFRQLKQTLQQLQQAYPQLDTLSMGMSNDYELAITEGATMVRIGGALFGEEK